MSEANDAEPKSHSLIPWIVGAVVVLVAAVLAVPGLFTSCRVSNDTSSISMLKVLSCAEGDFRSNDRDWNHVNDYWTGDVKSLYTLTSSAAKGTLGLTDDPPIKLIDLATACSDVDGTLVEAGGENMLLSSFSVPSAKRGYWHAALLTDRSGASESPYKLDTGGEPPMGSCHHESKFGFVALPDSLSAGPYVYIINENCTVYKSPAIRVAHRSRDPLPAPPGMKWIAPEFLSWPDEKTLQVYWSKHD
jgi:hypothetical protein